MLRVIFDLAFELLRGGREAQPQKAFLIPFEAYQKECKQFVIARSSGNEKTKELFI